MRKRPKDPMALVGIIFATIGLVFVCVAGVFIFRDLRFFSSAKKVEGEIIGFVRETHNGDQDTWPVVRYTAEGKEREATLGYYSSSMHAGKKLTLYYKEGSPTDVRVKTWLFQLIFGSIGGVFAVGGILLVVLPGKKSRRQKRLLAEGVPIYADFDHVEQNSSLTVNGRSPYRVICRYIDQRTGTVHYFKSGNLWDDPSPYFAPGSKVTVFTDGGNFDRYAVDVERALPNVEYH